MIPKIILLIHEEKCIFLYCPFIHSKFIEYLLWVRLYAWYDMLGIELAPKSQVSFYIIKREQINFRKAASSLPSTLD